MAERQPRASGAAARPPAPQSPAQPAKLVGHQVIKFSPDGKVLLTLGKAGVAGNPPEVLTEPNDVVTAPNGDIFVAEGHSGQNGERDARHRGAHLEVHQGRQVHQVVGQVRHRRRANSMTPHSARASISRGRLFVADRGNVRLQIFDQDGKFLTEIEGTSAASAASASTKRRHALRRRLGVESDRRIPAAGSAASASAARRISKVQHFIPDAENPDPAKTTAGTSAAEGVAVDRRRATSTAPEVGPKSRQEVREGDAAHNSELA